MKKNIKKTDLRFLPSSPKSYREWAIDMWGDMTPEHQTIESLLEVREVDLASAELKVDALREWVAVLRASLEKKRLEQIVGEVQRIENKLQQ